MSADTIVPDPTNPQDLNRFSYVRNNPLKYTDPSGNVPIDCYGDPGYCEGTPAPNPPAPIPIPIPEPEPGPIFEFPTEPIPVIIVGPILVPITLPDLVEPSECKPLEQQYHAALDEMFSLQEQIHYLQETLRRTTDPQHKRELETQIRQLNLRLGAAIEKRNEILRRARGMGCSFAK